MKTRASVAPAGLQALLNISIKTNKRYKQRPGVTTTSFWLEICRKKIAMHILTSAPRSLEGESPVLVSKTGPQFSRCYRVNYETKL